MEALARIARALVRRKQKAPRLMRLRALTLLVFVVLPL